MRRLLIVFAFLLILVVGSVGLFFREEIMERFTREQYSAEKETQDIAEAKRLLEEGQARAAMEIIERYRTRFESNDDVSKEWVNLYVDASVAARAPSKLILLYETFPEAVNQNEEAALLIADIMIKTSRTQDYLELRDKWKGRETEQAKWFVLDADRMLLEGGRVSAINFLNTRSFEGKEDIGRLLRLGLLNARENPRMAWEYLSEAYSKDPENTEVRSYRARLLEAVGKKPLALTEYLAAARLDPSNLMLRDQLAEFYRRNGRYKLAMKVWEEALESTGSDFIWVKTLFWSRVATPADYDFAELDIPDGYLKPYVEYLLSLEDGQFWDAAKFAKLDEGNRYLQSQQSAFWLRLLQAYKDDDQKAAFELLQYNHFTPVSWNPHLELLLKRVMTFRQNRTFNLDQTFGETEALALLETDDDQTQSQRHPLYQSIEELAAQEDSISTESGNLPEGLNELLTGSDAYSACFLAGGWLESALDLLESTIMPASYPEWYTYGITQAYRYNRGTLPALEFATKQPPTPALSMVMGELLIASGSPNAGLDKLKQLTDREDDIGFRAAWLISLLYIEQERYDEAKELVQTHDRLSQDVLGKETLARIALLEGDREQATKLYSALEDNSWEAKSYLARQAFLEKNWDRARELTEQLLREFPNNMLLHQNLRQIMEEQAKRDGATEVEASKSNE